MNNKREKRIRRHKRVRAKIKGTADRPRFSIFRSNRHVMLQLIDDEAAITVVAASDRELKKKKGTKKELVSATGELLAKKAKDKKIVRAVFDRSGYAYHGLVKEAADGARRGGLEF